MGFHAEKSQLQCVNFGLSGFICAAQILFALLLACPTRLTSQATVGIQPFGSYQGDLDKINLADLGIHIDIPLFVHQARGANNGVSVHLIYGTSYGQYNSTGEYDAGWRVVASAAGGTEVSWHRS